MWPVPVVLKEDESLSSWLVRAALAQGCDPIALTGWLWPRWRAWTHDLDRGIHGEKKEAILRCSSLTKKDLDIASLANEACNFSTRDLPQNGVWPWVQALGARNRLYRGGLQFCPECFQNDNSPFLRKHWRFSWVAACQKHKVQLIDRCPHCHKPIEPHRLQAMQTTLLSICASCGQELSDCSSTPVSKAVLNFQQIANQVIRSGVGKIDEEVVSASKWFDACRHLLTLRRRASYYPDSAFSLAMREACRNFNTLNPEKLAFQLEMLDVTTRTKLIQDLYSLMNNLQEFSTYLACAGAQKTCLETKNHELPYPLSFLANNLQSPKSRNVASNRTNRLRPRSKVTVLKMWARIKRKYRLR